METINIELRIDKVVDVAVPIDDVIEGINLLEMPRRWNYVAQIINCVELDIENLNDEQKAIIKKYLTKKITLF